MGRSFSASMGAAQLHAGEVRLHGLEQRVRAARESSAVIVHADEVSAASLPAPAG